MTVCCSTRWGGPGVGWGLRRAGSAAALLPLQCTDSLRRHSCCTRCASRPAQHGGMLYGGMCRLPQWPAPQRCSWV